MSTRNISINMFWTILVLLVIDLYVFMALRNSFKEEKWKKVHSWVFFLFSATGYVGLYFMYDYFSTKPLQPDALPNFLIGFFFSIFVVKVLLLAIFLLEDLYRLCLLTFYFLRNLLISEKAPTEGLGRRKFIRQTGLFLAAIPFSSMLYGITKGKYNYRVNTVKIGFKNLPSAFDGFKIVHISDIHSGSFDNKEAVLEGIDLVNEQAADLVLFTGDLVNNDSREIIPFIEDFKKIRSANGVYSVLGNHDYGDYKKWDSPEDKQHNMELLYQYQDQMGFKLLNNQNRTIERGGQEISIFGVENWGNPPFPQRGDLDLALDGKEQAPFKILMSHDPTHWNKKVVDHSVHFDLTLSGHTHGMQFGVEIPGFKWSPIKYIYPQWAGLYEKAGQYLYVNRGFGFLGFPGRVGIWPEITIIELQQQESFITS